MKLLKWNQSIGLWTLVTVFLLGTVLSCSDHGDEPAEILVERVTVTPRSLVLEIGQREGLKAQVFPAHATHAGLVWTSSDASVASVSEDGTVMAHAPGSATITVQAQGQSATCAVTVKEPALVLEKIVLTPQELKLTKAGEQQQLVASLEPEGVEAVLTWESSNPSVASVASDGTVTAHANGTATITARAEGKSATCAVTVDIQPEDLKGDELEGYEEDQGHID